MATLQKLREIRKRKTLYDICFRRAGVALQFYDASRIIKPAYKKRFKSKLTKECGLDKEFDLANWREGLFVEHYYPTFEEAVKAEYKKIEGGEK